MKSSERKPIFFTSDWHIGHANVIAFDNRPYTNVNQMAKCLIANYNSTVPKNGICYFLGDMGLCNNDTLKDVISQLNGTKVLVLGNHDKNMHSMYNKGFDVVLNSAIIYIGRYRVSMSHCPLPGVFREDIAGMKGAKEGDNWHGESKNQAYTSFDIKADYHIHGHIHSTKENGKHRILGNQIDVGVAANGYRPISISVIESWITLTEQVKASILEHK